MKLAKLPMRLNSLLLSMALLVAGRNPASPSSLDQTTRQNERLALARLPLHFEANCGQTDASVKFLARGRGCSLFLAPDEVVLNLRSARKQTRGDGPSGTGQPATLRATHGDQSFTTLRLRLLGASSSPRMTGLDELPGRVNYFKGNDPSKWRTNVATYARVKYENVYPGIDLVFYGSNEQQLEFDFAVGSGANPNAIKLAFEGADKVETDANGNLRLLAAGEEILLHKPRLYQMNEGRLEEVVGDYLVREASSPHCPLEVGFQVAAYDLARQLVIDPVLSYSTYLGGSGYDGGMGIAVDTNGYAYLVGFTQSPDFPTTNAVDPTLKDTDAFVAKLKPDSSGFVYATYIGGSSGDQGNAIAVDAAGNAYVTGAAGSLNFPVVNGFQASAGGWKAFVTKLNSNGSAILYSTYLGGTGDDRGVGIAVDDVGGAYVTGSTSSTNFPTRNPLQSDFHGGGPNNPYNSKGDAFVAKIDTTVTGSASLVYSTYLGGNDDDVAKGIAVDAAGNAYVAGYTASTNFPTTVGAFQPSFAGGDYDIFVTKLNPSGTALVYSTYLGGSGNDNNGGGCIAVDSAGNAFVTGQTGSSDFPTKNAWQPTQASRWQPSLAGHGFVSKLNSGGSDLVYSTYLFGVPYTGGIAVDQADSAYVVGQAEVDFPTVNAVQPVYGGGDGNELDGFVLKMDPDGQSALYATFLGGTNGEFCTGIAVGRDGNAYVTGYTSSTNFPTQNAFQSAFGGGSADAFLAKISDPDTNPPFILAASNYGDSNVVTIGFSEALAVASANNPTNYALDHGVTVSSVVMGMNSKTVRLLTSGLANGVTYTLTVNGVLDRAPMPNSIATDSHAIFTALGLYRGFLRQERYDGIVSGRLADLTNNVKFPDHPDATNVVHQFEVLPYGVPAGGLRLTGYLLPPVTGEYTFYLSSRDESVLFLSKNESPLNLVQIAWAPYGGGSRHWNYYTAGFPTNATPNNSLPVHLEAGKAYYVEAVADSDAPDALGVAWRIPGRPAPLDKDPPVPGNYLAVLGNPQAATLTIVQQPQDATVAEGQTAAFSVKATASPASIFYQWRKNGVELPDANGISFITSEAALAENGSFYDCVLTIPGATVTSRAALLTVTNDVSPPALVSAEGNLTLTNITLIFSEPINAGDATNTANYALSGGLAVSSAVLLADRRTVVLTTSPQTSGSSYTVQVSGIRDRSTAGNGVVAGTQAPFFGWVDEEFVGPFPSWANVKNVYGAAGDGVADDTAALQQALNEVATPGHAAVLYLPTGTYRITQTLNLESRLAVSLVGEDPVTTIIKWDGPTNTDMMLANGVAYSRWSRLTWDGSGKARYAVHHTQIGGLYQVTGNIHTDEIIKDAVVGLIADPASGGDGHDVIRCHFLRCFNGIAVVNFNTIDWHIWDSVFEDCDYGVHAYAANFHVYRNLFLRSTEADLVLDTMYYGIRGNTSIGSKAFVAGYAFVPTTIQGNTVIDSLDPNPIHPPGGGPITLLDNTIVSRADAPAGPVVEVDDNLLSAGNTFTVPRPIAVGGRSIMMQDQIVSRDSLALPPAMVPRFLPKSSSPVIEVPAGASAAVIQRAIDTAASMNGSRPVVHLPMGNFVVDHTLIIPPGCDLQLVGDGPGDGNSNRGTRLQPTGSLGGTLLRVDGPSHATLREFAIGSSNQGLVVDNCDQPGARVFMEKVDVAGSDVNLLVDRLDNTDVCLQNFYHGVAAEVSVRVIGGAAQAAGLPTSGRVDLFGGESAQNQLTYQVEQGGRLLVEDCWYEGDGPLRFMRLSDSGTLTINSAQIATGPNFVPDAIKLDNFHGQLAILNALMTQTGVLVNGDGAATDLLLLGCRGDTYGTLTNGQSYLDNQSPNAHVEHLMSSSDNWEVPNVGEGDPVFLRKMLSQVRTETPRRLVPLPPEVTDVRLFRVTVSGYGGCRTAIQLTGTNAPPHLAATSDQVVDEGATLSLANIATDDDLPYQTLSFSLLPGAPYGASVNPTNGVFTWTPREEQGPSTNFIQVVVADDGSPSLSATNSFTVIVREVNTPPRLGVPDPATILQAGDIGILGDPLEAGSSVFTPDGAIMVQAGGSGLWANDAFHFTYQKIPGDFDVRVRIVSLEPRDTYSFAGLMAREGMEANSRFFAIGVWPAGPTLDGVSVEGRDSYATSCRESMEGGVTGWGSESPGVPYPNAWLRFKREGDTFFAFRGTNGIDWTPLASRTVPVPFLTELFLGVATYSANNGPGQTTHAEYDNYGSFPPPPPSPLTDWTINEGDTLTFNAPAYDLDVPFQLLTFKLGTDAPAGASIDPTTGLFEWTPSEAQGPGIYPITIIVTDNGTPPLSASNSFTVTVREVNTAPALGLLSDLVVNPGQNIAFTVPAVDSDLPTNTLTFSLVAAPPGASLDSASGLFSWRPGMGQAASTNIITLRVTDFNPWALVDQRLSDTKSFAVTVRALGPVLLEPRAYTNGWLVLSVAGPLGPDYIVQGSIDLNTWTNIGTNTPVILPFTFTDTNANAFSNRYYRAVLAP
jgi:hypothetical protein